jgi:uncharacterized secreted repeat protein (TIGR03808 family)
MHHIKPTATRRSVLAGLAVLAASATSTRAQSVLDATSIGLIGNAPHDQSAVLQQAINSASTAGQTLRLPSGVIRAGNLVFPSNLTIEGVPGSTELRAIGAIIARANKCTALILRNVDFSAEGAAADLPALLAIEASEAIAIERCAFRHAPAIALAISDASVTIRDCVFDQIGDAAIHAMDSRSLLIDGNRIDDCGNAGIRIWRSSNGPDGTIITSNRVGRIDWRGGGNGQNGNGINVFKADEVIIANNRLFDCAFTAIRLNATNNTQILGNACLRSGEVAIFSEFGFSGSVIANNIVDGAATGISMTNMDSGGQIAVCSGNIVRNIAPNSAVNPDTVPLGIAAEADAAISGNTIHNVPGLGILAGYGPFLRNVTISANTIAECDTGIGVSVVDGAGRVHLGANLVAARQHEVVGLAWADIVEPDLLDNLGRYPNVSSS